MVNVIDENHSEAWSYLNIYFSPRARLDNWDGALPFNGPNRISDHYAALEHAPEGWKMSHRKRQVIFRSKSGELPPETWADKEGLMATQKPSKR